MMHLIGQAMQNMPKPQPTRRGFLKMAAGAAGAAWSSSPAGMASLCGEGGTALYWSVGTATKKRVAAAAMAMPMPDAPPQRAREDQRGGGSGVA